nr:hypothetical protein [Corynebacterium pacaense]
MTRELTRLYESTPGAVMLTADAHAHVTYLCASVWQELAFGLEQRGINDPARIREVAGILDLTDLLHRPPNKLSGGQTRRLAIGCVAVIPAPLKLFDAPFSGLDTPGRAAVATLLRSLDAEVVVGDHRVRFDDAPVTYLGEIIDDVELPDPVQARGTCEFTVRGRRGGASRSWWQFREPAGGNFEIGPFHKRIPRGAVVWLKGPNGSGKTTLMRALAGLDGAVAQPFTVGLMTQDPQDQIIDSTVGAMVPGGGDEHPLDLSARDLRLAQFDSVVADAPEVLCADEPDVGLDVAGSSLMHHRFAAFLSSGGTIVLACHDESFVEEVRRYASVEEWALPVNLNSHPCAQSLGSKG